MIIKRIKIENYLCYYGLKEFELSEGFNIILGENGEGKTKFFEAIDWLLNGDNRNLELLVSAKALAEAEVESPIRVSVEVCVEQFDVLKSVSKSFIVNKFRDGTISTVNYEIQGIKENIKGERILVDGNSLIEEIFPAKIRRYSMFKGEEQLDIFKNDDALMILINSFSKAKYFEKYAQKGEMLREKAEKAVDDATRNDNINKKQYGRLEIEIAELSKKKSQLVSTINSLEDQISKIEGLIIESEKYVNNAESLKIINERIYNIEQKIMNISNSINEDYTISLFDNTWILVNFENIKGEYCRKINEIAKRKRELQSEFDKQIGIEEGKRLKEAQLLDNAVPLPKGVPSKAHMEEMLKDEICKVCNRPAKKGSEPYNFMQKRLKEYLKSQIPVETEKEEKKSLYENDYVSRLFNLSVTLEDSLSNMRSVKKSIEDLFQFNNKRKLEKAELERHLEQEFSERDKVIGGSTIGAESLGNVLKNYNGWQSDLKRINAEILYKKNQLKEIEEQLGSKMTEKESIDIKTANTFLIKTREILRDIEEVFKSTKERKFDEFVKLLQEKSNVIFSKINIEAFTGEIIFRKKIIAGRDVIRIELLESSGKAFHKPNQSLLTSMHISILLAISELAAEQNMESFPMIFDAPTSSFGETKTTKFLNLIYTNRNQNILLIKDYLRINDKTKKLEVKNDFADVKRDKAFWVFLERPFDRKDLSTLNTQIISF